MASELPAGPALDAEVAREVFTQRVRRIGGYLRAEDARERGLYPPGTEWLQTAGTGWEPLPHYSTDWAAMGILVAHLTGQGWDVVMHAYRPSAHAYARLERSDSVIERYTAHGAHVPHAVARAALQTARPPAPGVE